jgi:hypothetical protein
MPANKRKAHVEPSASSGTSPTRRTAKPSTTTVINLTPRSVRPDVAAQYLGTVPSRIEELMRDGLLKFKILPGSDARVIPLKELDKFFDDLPLQSGALAGRGKNAA